MNNSLRITDPNGEGDPLKIMNIRDNQASNLFGMVRNGGTRPHQGFDFAAKTGTPILAVEKGEITKVIVDNRKDGYGTQIQLKFNNSDGKTEYAEYAHLSKVDVVRGQMVNEGDVIGETGRTGNASTLPISEAHLHFELRNSQNVGKGLAGRLDPNQVLDTKFYSQDPDANQTNTGVIKVEKNEKPKKQDIEKK